MEQHYRESEVRSIAQKILDTLKPNRSGATVIALEGDLGAGKTTLTQAIAAVLGIDEPLLSPTFVVMKRYAIPNKAFTHLVHIDAYRIEDVDELLPLHFESILEEPGTLLIIEWPEKIRSALPSDINYFKITHEGSARHLQKIHE